MTQKGNTIFDERGRALAKFVYYGKRRDIERTPTCTIGEYFAILSWLMDQNEEAAS